MTDLISREPLPCPFCGSTNFDVRDGSTFRWRVPYCVDCEATASEVRIQTSGEGTKEEWEAQARGAAIEEWNTRHAATGVVVPRDTEIESVIKAILWETRLIGNRRGDALRKPHRTAPSPDDATLRRAILEIAIQVAKGGK